MMKELQILKENRILQSFSTELCAGFTTGYRKDGESGSMAFQPRLDPSHTLENRSIFCSQLQVEEHAFRSLSQCHGKKVQKAEDFSSHEATEGDALITDRPGLLLTIFLADCVPLLFYDPVHKAVAAVHGGWRGTAENIAGETLETMRGCYQTRPEDLRVFIGPSIGSCCYTVGEEVETIFRERFSFHDQIIDKTQGSPRLDLRKTHSLALQQAGVKEMHIGISSLCTCCGTEKLPSYRKSGASAGRFSAFILIRN